jgi:hypothetical protein
MVGSVVKSRVREVRLMREGVKGISGAGCRWCRETVVFDLFDRVQLAYGRQSRWISPVWMYFCSTPS